MNQSDNYFRFRAGSAELKVTVDSYENEKIVLSVIELTACQDNNLLRQITLTPNEMKFCYGEPGMCDVSIGYEIGWWKSYEEFTHYMEIRFEKEDTHIEQVWEPKQHKNRLKGLSKWLRF